MTTRHIFNQRTLGRWLGLIVICCLVVACTSSDAEEALVVDSQQSAPDPVETTTSTQVVTTETTVKTAIYQPQLESPTSTTESVIEDQPETSSVQLLEANCQSAYEPQVATAYLGYLEAARSVAASYQLHLSAHETGERVLGTYEELVQTMLAGSCWRGAVFKQSGWSDAVLSGNWLAERAAELPAEGDELPRLWPLECADGVFTPNAWSRSSLWSQWYRARTRGWKPWSWDTAPQRVQLSRAFNQSLRPHPELTPRFSWAGWSGVILILGQ